MKDIFFEDKVTPVKGLIRRYHARVLVELTMKCPIDCEFCFRKWKKEENRETLTKNEADKIVEYISKNKEITEVIFSGGEPLMAVGLMEYLIKKLKVLDQIKIFRIHSRAVVTAPLLVSEKFLKILKGKYKQIIYLSIHINSDKELNSEVELAIEKIRKTGVILYSQSVFLKGINDSVEVLEELFSRLIEIGVRPYNIYQCNKIEGIEHFIVPLKKEREIITELRKRISGLACPTLIFDVPENANKIPVSLDFWEDKKTIIDFNGKKFLIDE
ncbi:MAG: KamA family radical SAM protein [Candidatus Shapirobacteria bacterium]|nr:KamA family radical SAM protein [Candidatus Shapirobacteria bacterium]MDD4410362.1 KamA family radical SAM protein [Candidatus Shapirobacteria bacterium]